MGFYLSKPITEKETIQGQCKKFNHVVSGMQGWRIEMEDSHIVYENEATNTYIFGVFDGHGGREVAKFAAAHYQNVLLNNPNFKKKKYEDALKESFYEIDDMLLKPEFRKELKQYKAKPAGQKETKGDNDETFESQAGCTANVVLIVDNDLYVANAGDSRSILGEDKSVVELSIDHKPDMETEKNRIVKAGGSVFNGRVNGNLSLSRALGDFDYKQQNNIPRDQQLIIATPEITHRVIKDTTEFLIVGCDGIWETWTSQKVSEFVRDKLSEKKNLKDVVEPLMDALLAKDTSCIHGLDNMTCIIVEFKKN